LKIDEEEESVEEIEEEEYDDTLEKEESSEESDDDDFNVNDFNRGIIAGAGAMWGYDPKKRFGHNSLLFILLFIYFSFHKQTNEDQRKSKKERNQNKMTRVLAVAPMEISLHVQECHNNPKFQWLPLLQIKQQQDQQLIILILILIINEDYQNNHKCHRKAEEVNNKMNKIKRMRMRLNSNMMTVQVNQVDIHVIPFLVLHLLILQ
jgi:hypothetical protein